MEAVVDLSEVESVLEFVDEIVEDFFDLELSLIRERKWVALPVESSSHLTEADALTLSNAISAFGHQDIFAVAVEPLAEMPKYIRVESTVDDFMAFDLQCGHFFYAFIPSDCSFIIIFTVSDYYIITRKREFVIEALGMNIYAAGKVFSSFIKSWPSERDRTRFAKVEKRYTEFN